MNKKLWIPIGMAIAAGLVALILFVLVPALKPAPTATPTRVPKAAVAVATAPAVSKVATAAPQAAAPIAAPTAKSGRKSGGTGGLSSSSGDALSLEGVIPTESSVPGKQAVSPTAQASEGLTVEVSKVGNDWVDINVEIDPTSDLIADSLTGTYAGTGEVKEFKPSATKPVTIKGLAVCRPYIVSVSAQNDEGRLNTATASFRTTGCAKGDEKPKASGQQAKSTGTDEGGVSFWQRLLGFGIYLLVLFGLWWLPTKLYDAEVLINRIPGPWGWPFWHFRKAEIPILVKLIIGLLLVGFLVAAVVWLPTKF